MNPKLINRRYLWIILIPLLVGCGPVATTVRPTEVDVNAISTQAVRTVMVQMTQTVALTETPSPTQTRTPAPTRTSLPFVAVDGLRVSYVIDDNLYIQDSGGQPTQMAQIGYGHPPIFSDDGKKIVFYLKNEKPNDKYEIHVINIDGSREQALVTNNLLVTLNLGYDESAELRNMVFVPGTHKLLFNTEQFPSSYLRGGDISPQSNQDLLLVDTDSTKITQLFAPGKASYFQPSPNGKLVWVLSANHIDVVDLDGKFRYRVVDYTPVLPDTYIAMPDMFWTQDSNKLSLALPPAKTAFGYTGPKPRTIWQYSFTGSPAIEIRLNPPPINFSTISPDGNWIVYQYFDYLGNNDQTAPSGIYLGNLRKGSSELLDLNELNGFSSFSSWSPDSTHFIVHDLQDRIYLGDIHGKITPLRGVMFRGWIDNTHYFYGLGLMGEIGRQEDVRVVELPAGMPEYLSTIFLKSEMNK